MPDSSSQSSRLTLVIAQVNPLVGDIPGNTSLLLDSAWRALSDHDADIVVFPELMLTGYPPEDLLLRPSLDRRIDTAIRAICDAALPCRLVFGYPGREQGKLYNMLAVIHAGRVEARHRKQCLPNYQVFDEKRYFTPGEGPCVLDVEGIPLAFSICEDMWEPGPMSQAAGAGARVMISINSSPFHRGKLHERREVLAARVREGSMPLVYLNQVGGQDELVFDGGSMALAADGEVVLQCPEFRPTLQSLELVADSAGQVSLAPPRDYSPHQPLDELGSIYNALVLGVRDYIDKNGFSGVVLGLSGGIDSGLTLAVAVDALGAERVHAVMMPYEYTSRMSLEDSEAESRTLGVSYRVIPIAGMYESFMTGLADEFSGLEPDLTEQNLQARCRAVILMAISNKKGLLVLTTGNKSELAVGYSTLYGDMAGGFDVLKDVPKMTVYALADYRNRHFDGGPVIPQRVIDRPPSAELAPDQVDEDNLPPYEVLDEILARYIEEDLSAHAIIEQGYTEADVYRVLKLVDINEYKRRQAPIGVRITRRGFGRDRRYPVTSGWKPGE